MKLYYLGVYRNAKLPAHELCCAKDASSFAFWERPTVNDFMTLFSQGLADGEDTKAGQRQEIYEGDYKFHTLGHGNGVVGIIMSDNQYPKMVAQSILGQVLDDFTTKYPSSTYAAGTPTLSFPELATYLSKYQDPSAADNIMRIQKELADTQDILHKTLEAALQRGVKIDELVDKSQTLSATSKAFYTKAKQQNSCCILM